MTDTAIVSDEMAKKFETEKDTPYERWVRSEGLEIIPAHYVRNLRTVALRPRASRGGHGVSSIMCSPRWSEQTEMLSVRSIIGREVGRNRTGFIRRRKSEPIEHVRNDAGPFAFLTLGGGNTFEIVTKHAARFD